MGRRYLPVDKAASLSLKLTGIVDGPLVTQEKVTEVDGRDTEREVRPMARAQGH
jgi:hypothetical protein